MTAGKPLWAMADAAAAPQLPVVDGWTELVHLVPADVGVVPQHAGLGASGDWYLTQGRDNSTGTNATDDLLISRFDPAGARRGTMTIPRGGHGDRLVMRGDDVGVYVGGIWCWLTWRASTLSIAGAQQQHGTRARCPLGAREYCQGEVDLGRGRWVRLYGGSIKGGSERDPSHPAPYLEVIDGTKITRTIKLPTGLGRKNSLPIGGRFEPEGLAQTDINGQPWLLVGYAIGRLGNTTLLVYGRPTADVL